MSNAPNSGPTLRDRMLAAMLLAVIASTLWLVMVEMGLI